VYERLTDSTRALLHYVGDHELKGISRPVPVYGLPPEAGAE
jgi:class 3 adenylate cyclase